MVIAAAIPNNIWVPAAAAFVAVALTTVSLIVLWEWWREYRQRRNVVAQLRVLVDQPSDPAEGPLLRTGPEDAPWVSALADRLPALGDMGFMMQQAGITWSLQTFVLLSLGLGAACGVAAVILSHSVWWTTGAVVVGAFLPYLTIKRRRKRRFAAFEEQLPESIELIGRALRAGHPLSSGFKMAADDGGEPVASEFRRVFEEQRFGLPMQESLLNLGDRVGLMDVRILVTAILIQREVGGNLAEILDNLAAVVRARFTIRRQLRVYTAQGRMTGYLLAGLPLVLFGILYLMNPSYMSILFTDPTGRVIAMFGILLQILGFFWIRRIVDIEI